MQKNSREIIRRASAMTIRNLRAQVGISQENLAYETGVDRGYMSGLERGKSSPTVETIYKLLPGLNVTFPQFAEEMDRCVRRVRRAPVP
jgi:transcriptional regulator with XRE-family HTH domain